MAVSLRHALALTVVVCGMVAVCPTFVSPVSVASPGTPTTCAQLRAWAEAYRDATVTLDEFARFDRARRGAVFAAIAPAVRATLWREHLLRQSRQTAWSVAQRALFLEALPLVTPELYEQHPDALLALERFAEKVNITFTENAEKRAWFDLAGPGPVLPLAPISQVPWCNCSLAFQDCFGGAPCNDNPCKAFGPGCGMAGAYSCDGRCAW